jgi:hypothetical protein
VISDGSNVYLTGDTGIYGLTPAEHPAVTTKPAPHKSAPKKKQKHG